MDLDVRLNTGYKQKRIPSKWTLCLGIHVTNTSF